MGLDVVDTKKRYPVRQRYPLCKTDSHQQAALEPGPLSYCHDIDLLKGELEVAKDFLR